MGQKLGTRLRGLLLVIGTVIFGVVVGYLTNLVTGNDGRLWPFLLASVVGLVACSALLWLLEQRGGLAFGMDHRFERDRKKALGRFAHTSGTYSLSPSRGCGRWTSRWPMATGARCLRLCRWPTVSMSRC